MGNELGTPLPSQLPPAARQHVLDGNLSLEGIAKKIQSGDVRKIVVMTGAGISVSAGIPDFRTPGSGLYSQLDDLGLPCPEAVFHIKYFRYDPRPFYLLAKRLFPGTFSPTDAHFFSVLLEQKGLLLRHYTQNIDNLELLAGLPAERLVEAHGSFADVHCIDCGRQYPIGWFRQQVLSGDVERCAGWVGHGETQLEALKKVEGVELAEKQEDLPVREQPLKEQPQRKLSQSSPNLHFTECRMDDMEVPPSMESPVIPSPMKTAKSLPSPLRSSKLLSTDCDNSDSSSWSGDADSDGLGGGEGGWERVVEEKDSIRNSFGDSAKNAVKESVENAKNSVKDSLRDSVESSVKDRRNLTDNPNKRLNGLDGCRESSPPGRRCNGLIKPDIVFFGEGLPKRFGLLSVKDLAEAELLIVMGTSLQVYPFADLLHLANPYCARLLINKDLVGLSFNGGADGRFLFEDSENYRDVYYEGECDRGVRRLCQLLGWEMELDELKRKYCEKPMEHWKILEEQQSLEDGKTFF